MSDSQSPPALPAAMNFEEKLVLDFLKPCPRIYFSVREIGRKAGTRRQFYENPEWPLPHLQFLTQKGFLLVNPMGHYCFVPQDEHEKKPYKQGDHLKLLSPEEAAQAAKAAKEAAEPDNQPFGTGLLPAQAEQSPAVKKPSV